MTICGLAGDGHPGIPSHRSESINDHSRLRRLTVADVITASGPPWTALAALKDTVAFPSGTDADPAHRCFVT